MRDLVFFFRSPYNRVLLTMGDELPLQSLSAPRCASGDLYGDGLRAIDRIFIHPPTVALLSGLTPQKTVHVQQCTLCSFRRFVHC